MEIEDQRGQYLAATLSHIFPTERHEDGTLTFHTPKGVSWYYIDEEGDTNIFAHLPVKSGTHKGAKMVTDDLEELLLGMASGEVPVVSPTWIKVKARELMRTDPEASSIAALRDLTQAAEDLYK